MTNLKLMSGILLIAQLFGCAVISKTECLDADWQQLGYHAGFKGEQDVVNAFSKRADACASYGGVADLPAFESGYAAGIERFCSIPNAVRLGERGARRAINDQLCPEEQHLGFGSAFQAGYRLYQLRSQVQEIRSEIDRLKAQANRYHRTMEQLGQQLQSGDLSQQETRRAQYRWEQLRRDINRIRSNIYDHRDRLIQGVRAVDTYAELLDIEYGEDRN